MIESGTAMSSTRLNCKSKIWRSNVRAAALELPTDKGLRLSLWWSNSSGVKDVIDEIEVEPASPMDDEIRIAMFRAVYGYPSLNKYAMDPSENDSYRRRPRGNVELWGVVDMAHN